MSDVPKEKSFPITYVCGFCGRHKQDTLPVKLERSYKVLRGCDRCTIRGRKGERARLCSRYLQRVGFSQFADARRPEDVMIVAKSKQWQHGTTIYVEGSAADSYDLMDFVPADYEPSDAQLVREKLLALGAEYVSTVGLSCGALFTAWTLGGSDLVFAFDGEHVAIYDSVGKRTGDDDLTLYLERRAAGK